MTPKAIGDQVFNMAIMGAFAIPEAGPIISAALATGMGLFNIFVPDLVAPTGLQNTNKQDLEDAVSKMKDSMSDALFNNDVDNATTWIINFNSDQLLANIALAKVLGLDKNSLFFATDNTTQGDVKKLNAFFAPDAANLQDLLDNRDVITRSSKNDTNLTPADLAAHRTDTTGLYCLAGSAIVLYLKTAIAWQWSMEQLYCGTYPKWLAAEKLWLKQSQSYRDIHPDEDPDVIYPGVKNKSAPLPEWQNWVQLAPVQELQNKVKDLLTYSIYDDVNKVDGLYKTMVANWQDRHNSMVATLGIPSPLSDDLVGSFLGLRNIPENTSQIVAFKNVLDEILVGVELVETWESSTTQHSLHNVAYSDLKLYHDSLGLWQDALDQVKFQTLTGLDTDTPKTIAQRFYNDATLYTKLLDLNDKPFANGDMSLAGVRVKVPDQNTNRVKVPDLPTNKF